MQEGRLPVGQCTPSSMARLYIRGKWEEIYVGFQSPSPEQLEGLLGLSDKS